MKAMILAAGLGTRLRPLTDDRPKALVEVAGHTLLEIAIRRLQSFGVRELIVNVHHCADMVTRYLGAKHNFGLRIEISREDDLLDTGGGLKKAAWFFQQKEKGSGSDDPFYVHNVDVISSVDLNVMLQSHRRSGALATLAVQDRDTSRYLMFDKHLQLCGRRTGKMSEAELVRPVAQVQPLAFCGIHVISPRIFPLMKEEGAFSIIDAYLSLAARENVTGFRADECYWRDLGTPANLTQAAEDLQSGLWQLASSQG